MEAAKAQEELANTVIEGYSSDETVRWDAERTLDIVAYPHALSSAVSMYTSGSLPSVWPALGSAWLCSVRDCLLDDKMMWKPH